MKFCGYLLLLFLLVVFSCNTESDKTNSNNNLQEIDSSEDIFSGNKEMVEILSKISSSKDLGMKYYFAKERAQYLYSSFNPKNRNWVGQKFSYITALLNSGQSLAAVKECELLISQLESKGFSIEDKLKELYEFLAISYLRAGEQENCINNHSVESCVVPIKGGGIYKEKSYSEKAIAIYEKILQYHEDDLQSIWLLNLAYMTIGKHPEAVPPKFVVPLSVINSKTQIKQFINISEATKTGIWGLAGGSIIEDFNNDGLLDIMASSWGLSGSDQLRYLENTGTGEFKDKTKESGLKGLIGGLNIIHSDYNNDGFADVLVLRGGWIKAKRQQPNSLLRNNGDGTFTDVTKEAGLLNYKPTQTAAWADYNLDGFVDLFIGNESYKENNNPCELWKNNGNGTFSNVSDEMGLNLIGYAKGVAWGDINNDKLPDLYISFLNKANRLFLNEGLQNDHWAFKDISIKSKTIEPIVSFPVWFWDYNNDGFQDIFVSSYESPNGSFTRFVIADMIGIDRGTGYPKVYKNNGDLTFSDQTQTTGMTTPIYAMGCNYGDLNNDGYDDIFTGTGAPDFRTVIPNRVFLNDLANKFDEVTTSGGFGNIQKGHGVSFGDLDNDGDQDIYMVMGGAYESDVFQNALYLNPYQDDHSWINLKLVGTKSNRFAIGAKVKITVSNTTGKKSTLYSTVSSGGSFGASSIQIEMGLNDAVKIDEILINWPHLDSEDQVFTDVGINQFLQIEEANPEIKVLERKKIQLSQKIAKTETRHIH